MEEMSVDLHLPMDKLSVESNSKDGSGRGGVVLVATGSFNPPTYMHLRMFELAKDELQQRGYSVLGGYLSPVNDAYKKKDLLPATHRIQLCERACISSSFVMVDQWEAMQKGYKRTLTVLSRIRNSLCQTGLVDQDNLKVMLLCGSDLLESFSTPGVWIPDQVKTICKDYGVVCIHREGKDVGDLISNSEILQECRVQIYRGCFAGLHSKTPGGVVSSQPNTPTLKLYGAAAPPGASGAVVYFGGVSFFQL